jgi:hypothetical protein
LEHAFAVAKPEGTVNLSAVAIDRNASFLIIPSQLAEFLW